MTHSGDRLGKAAKTMGRYRRCIQGQPATTPLAVLPTVLLSGTVS